MLVGHRSEWGIVCVGGCGLTDLIIDRAPGAVEQSELIRVLKTFGGGCLVYFDGFDNWHVYINDMCTFSEPNSFFVTSRHSGLSLGVSVSRSEIFCRWHVRI